MNNIEQTATPSRINLPPSPEVVTYFSGRPSDITAAIDLSTINSAVNGAVLAVSPDQMCLTTAGRTSVNLVSAADVLAQANVSAETNTDLLAIAGVADLALLAAALSTKDPKTRLALISTWLAANSAACASATAQPALPQATQAAAAVATTEATAEAGVVKQNYTDYVIKPGDTIFGIATRKYGISVAAIQAANPGLNIQKIYAGQIIHIPVARQPDQLPVAAAQVPEQTGGQATHRVAAGENLFRIALKYGVSVDALARANNITDPAKISVGQRLVIPGVNRSKSIAAAPPPAPTRSSRPPPPAAKPAAPPPPAAIPAPTEASVQVAAVPVVPPPVVEGKSWESQATEDTAANFDLWVNNILLPFFENPNLGIEGYFPVVNGKASFQEVDIDLSVAGYGQFKGVAIRDLPAEARLLRTPMEKAFQDKRIWVGIINDFHGLGVQALVFRPSENSNMNFAIVAPQITIGKDYIIISGGSANPGNMLSSPAQALLMAFKAPPGGREERFFNVY